MIEQVQNYLLNLQESICNEVESLDGLAFFHKDSWTKQDNRGNGHNEELYQIGKVLRKGRCQFLSSQR